MSLLVVLSPAKSLDYETPAHVQHSTMPQFLDQAQDLIDILRPMSPEQLSELMSVSDKLGVLNATRYSKWSRKFTVENSKQAILAFNGDVYTGLDAATLNLNALDFAQKHLRILSGLYGLLRPLDLMQPYRLEMGTRLANPQGAHLYAYWKSVIANALNHEARGKTAVLVNLASEEYFKSIDLKVLKATVIHPVFQDYKNDQYKIISFFAKKARGLMARYIIDKRITDVQELKKFDVDGYAFSTDESTQNNWIFRRKEKTV